MTKPIPESTPGGVIWAEDVYSPPGAWHSASSDPAGRVLVLHGLFARLGHPEVLARSRAYLDRAAKLGVVARDGQAAALLRWQQAHASFLDERLELDAYLDALADAGQWLDAGDDGTAVAPAVAALGRAGRDLRARAAALLPAESPGLYQITQRECAAAVEATAALPKLPERCWSAADPATVALEAGAEQTWMALMREQGRFALCHQVGSLLRQLGGLGAQVYLPGGAREPDGFAFRRWDLALAGAAETRRLKPPLRLRYAIDHGWEPGLYLAGDISASPAAAAGPRRGLLAGLLPGRPS